MNSIEDFFKPYEDDLKKLLELGRTISEYQEILDRYDLEVKLVKIEV